VTEGGTAQVPTVYVVPHAQWSTGDISGCLLLESGEVLWSHISSSMGWLQRDLTSGFGDRREELERRYPDGYNVVVAEKEGDVPAEVQERNKAWASEKSGSKEVG
jgi:hypothetical protein